MRLERRKLRISADSADSANHLKLFYNQFLRIYIFYSNRHNKYIKFMKKSRNYDDIYLKQVCNSFIYDIHCWFKQKIANSFIYGKEKIANSFIYGKEKIANSFIYGKEKIANSFVYGIHSSFKEKIAYIAKKQVSNSFIYGIHSWFKQKRAYIARDNEKKRAYIARDNEKNRGNIERDHKNFNCYMLMLKL